MPPTLRKGCPLSCGSLQTSIRAHLRVSAAPVRCSPKATGSGVRSYVRNSLPAQPVDATQVLNLSAGVSNAKVFRGRSFS